jgi:hypothetical protein
MNLDFIMKVVFILSLLISSKHVVCTSKSNCCNVFSNLSQIIDLIHSSTVYTGFKEEMNRSSCDKSDLDLDLNSNVIFETSKYKRFQLAI